MFIVSESHVEWTRTSEKTSDCSNLSFLFALVEKSRVIPRKAPVWLVDLWKYESSHELHSTVMEERFIRFLYDVKGLPKRQKIQK